MSSHALEEPAPAAGSSAPLPARPRTSWAPTSAHIAKQAATARARLAELELRARELEHALAELGPQADGEGLLARHRIAAELRTIARATQAAWCELTIANPTHRDRHAAARTLLEAARDEAATDTPWRPER